MEIDKNWDKKNGDVVFYEDEHLYKNIKYPHIKYTSVTTIIEKYHEPFDKDFWSSYGAIKNILTEPIFKKSGTQAMMLDIKKFKYEWLSMLGISKEAYEIEKQNILEEWDRKNKEACEYGTQYHLERELSFYKNKKSKLTDYIDDKETDFVCERHNWDLSRENAILPEYLVYFSSKDGLINIAGQIDVLIKKGNDIFIIDFKSNAKGIESKAYYDPKLKRTKRMFYPISHIDDTTMNHYALQLSIYAFMLQQINPNFNIKMLKLLHKAKGQKEVPYLVPYLKKECEVLFYDIWKKGKIEKEKEILKNL